MSLLFPKVVSNGSLLLRFGTNDPDNVPTWLYLRISTPVAKKKVEECCYFVCVCVCVCVCEDDERCK